MDIQVDLDTLKDIDESFSFSEALTRILASHFSSVLCETGSDKDTMSNCEGIVLPMGQMSLYVTFAPTMDDTIRTSLPKEIRIALRSHKTIALLPSEPCAHRDILDSAAPGGPLPDDVAELVMPRLG